MPLRPPVLSLLWLADWTLENILPTLKPRTMHPPDPCQSALTSVVHFCGSGAYAFSAAGACLWAHTVPSWVWSH